MSTPQNDGIPSGDELILDPSQLDHVTRLERILDQWPFAIDKSKMGLGKMITGLSLIQRLKLPHVIVICPVNAETTWLLRSKQYNIPIQPITYGKLRSTGHHALKHELLDRSDDGDGFIVTPTFKRLVKEGVIVIVDEFHYVSNVNGQHKAVKALTSYIARKHTTSKILLLSGTPFIKECQVINILELVGVITQPKLAIYDKKFRHLKLLGAQQVIDFASQINDELTTTIRKQYPFTSTNVVSVCFQVYVNIIGGAISSAMIEPAREVVLQGFNGFFRSDQALVPLIDNLKQLTEYDAVTQTIGRTAGNSILACLRHIEISKVPIFYRKTVELLGEPSTKVCIFLHYTESLLRLADLLAEYAPLLHYGGVLQSQRTINIRQFQEPNVQHRVFIGNTLTCAENIELDDTSGEFPRVGLISPSFFTSRELQVVMRLHRRNTQSSSRVWIVFGDCGREEQAILRANRSHCAVMAQVTPEQLPGMTLPADYSSYHEPE